MFELGLIRNLSVVYYFFSSWYFYSCPLRDMVGKPLPEQLTQSWITWGFFIYLWFLITGNQGLLQISFSIPLTIHDINVRQWNTRSGTRAVHFSERHRPFLSFIDSVSQINIWPKTQKNVNKTGKGIRVSNVSLDNAAGCQHPGLHLQWQSRALEISLLAVNLSMTLWFSVSPIGIGREAC